METKCIKKIYRPLENELKKIEKHLEIVLDESTLLIIGFI